MIQKHNISIPPSFEGRVKPVAGNLAEVHSSLPDYTNCHIISKFTSKFPVSTQFNSKPKAELHMFTSISQYHLTLHCTFKSHYNH